MLDVCFSLSVFLSPYVNSTLRIVCLQAEHFREKVEVEKMRRNVEKKRNDTDNKI